jgi:hopanoid biosynthesis associated protein HpnK
VQAARSASDFRFQEFFSTRFSTELLKTFTLRSHLILFFICIGSRIAPRIYFLAADSHFHFYSPTYSSISPPRASIRFFAACYDLSLLAGNSIRMKQLILNADDFGMTRGVNEGIVRAHRDGVLTSATLMANGLAFDDAVQKAAENPKLGIGCHLVLVGGKSVAPAEKVPSLVDSQGNLPDSLALFVGRVSAGMIKTGEIERELKAQIQKIQSAGIILSHLDSHKHTHAHPRVMEVVGKIAQEFGITKIRRPVENLRDSWETTRGDAQGVSKQIVAAGAVRVVASRFEAIAEKYQLTCPDHFLGLAMTGQLGPAALCRMAEAVEEGSTEIMLHPGICDADLAASGSRLQQQRQNELDGLLDGGVRRAFLQRGIHFISYRELN